MLQEQIDAMLSGNLSFDTKNGEEEDGEGRVFVAHGDPKRGENNDRLIDQSMECFLCFFHGLSMVFPIMLSVYICIMFREIWDFKPCLLQVMRQRFATQPFGMFPSSTSY